MESQKVTKKELFDKMDTAFKGVEDQRYKGLEKLKTIQLIRNQSLEKEKTRLEAIHGTGAPRVQKIDSRLEYNKYMFKGLDTEIQNAGINVPPLKPNTWMVSGVVFDSAGTPAKKLSIGLFDEGGKWLRDLGYGCTGENGYFSITYPPDGKEIKDMYKSIVVFIRVFDANYHVLYKDDVPLLVEIGKMPYRRIFLPEEGEVCTPPEPGPEDTVVAPDDWAVKGRVVDKDGGGMAGLTVSLYDKDLLFDDYLGTRKTDDNGDFDFIYRREGFKDLFEKTPEIYLKILDKDGTLLYTSEKPVKAKPGEVKVFNIQIGTSKTGKGGKGEEERRRRE